MYPLLYRHVLTHIDSETAHHRALAALELAGRFAISRALLRRAFAPDERGMAVEALGMHFAHPLGLAAGFDKDARALPALDALGFSFIEIGSVTPQPQAGNPPPRIFRLTMDNALINRLGFPSAGMAAVADRLRALKGFSRPLWVSLGKNKTTPLEEAARDYCAVLEYLYAYGDAFVVNISSPNTPDLRRLQTRAYLNDLLVELRSAIDSVRGAAPRKPLLVKISPDLTWDEVNTILDLTLTHDVTGIIATNTTLARDSLRSRAADESGGLSGAPLRAQSTAIIRHIRQQIGDRLVIVGAGGVFSGADMREKLEAGATLVQAYTGFVYRGPGFVRSLTQAVQEPNAKAQGRSAFAGHAQNRPD